MLKEAIGEAETIEKAQEEACKKLGVSVEEAEFEVIQTPAKKTLGIFGGKRAKVKAYVNESKVKDAVNYVQNIVNLMKFSNVTVNFTEHENSATIDLNGNDVSYIIGRRGETLDAIQYLTNLVANKVHSDNVPYYRITINAEDYRQKREQTLKDLAKRMASKALRIKKVVSLEHMNPYERRIIHSEIQNINGVTSWSEGENHDRHVVIGINRRKDTKHFNKKENKTLAVENNENLRNKTVAKEEIEKSNKTSQLYEKVELQ